MDRIITIGKVVSTYGCRGQVKVLPLTDFPDRFLDMKSVSLEREGKIKKYDVAGARLHQKHIILSLAGIQDIEGAQSLRGSLIKVGRDELSPLPDGHYYIFDIVGLAVYDPGGTRLGDVEDVIQTGANDVYVVNTGGARPLLVPALKHMVRDIDIPSGRMVVDYREPDLQEGDGAVCR